MQEKKLIQEVNKVYEPMFVKPPRYVILMGGRGAGRSTVASQRANAKLTSTDYYRCAIMRFVLSDVRNSIYKEILDRAEENGIKDSLEINESTMTIKHGANSINAVGFRKSSSDQKSKLKSLANYNEIIIEEADEVSEEDFMQLDDSLRTVKGDITIILLLNPPSKAHWIVQRWFDLDPAYDEYGREVADFYKPKLKAGITDTLFISTSYLDNIQNIAQQSIANYENYRHVKPDHYWNMIRGFVPEVVRGKIFSNWKVIEEIPHEARLVRYGLDFGYTNDPTAIVAVYYYNGGYILDEICYKTMLKNRQIADIFKMKKEAMVIADSAEPKSIDELDEAGIMIEGCEKGADSIRNGIQIVQDQQISITRHSTNIITEYENYAWDEDKDGNSLQEPKGGDDHLMDAIRYALSSVARTTTGGEVAQKQQTIMRLNKVRQMDNSTK